jgi:excisionase family DNA binding protein
MAMMSRRAEMAVPARPFTVSSLAERWQCSDSHIYNLIQRGELPAKRLGKLIRIPAVAVAAFEDFEWPESERSAGQKTSISCGLQVDRVVEFRQARAIGKKPREP